MLDLNFGRKIITGLIVVFFSLASLIFPIKPVEAIYYVTKPNEENNQNSFSTQVGFFTENKGQWDQEILYIGNTNFGKVAFTKKAIYYHLIKENKKEIEQKEKISPSNLFTGESQNQLHNYQSHTIKLSFENPILPIIQGEGVLSHYNNYLIGSNPKNWASRCKNYSKVIYQNIWTGIDLAYFFSPHGLKYEFYVQPEAKISNLQIKVFGARISNQGNLLHLKTPIGEILDSNLEVFDQKTSLSIKSSFFVKDDIISFKGIPKKRENTFVIDPLLFSTYLGGSSGDIEYGIATDGNTYITGYSTSADFPTTPGSYQTSPKGAGDAFVSKLNPTGTSLLYSTYLGGSGVEVGEGIAVDADGNTYITGYSTSADFPTTPGAFQTKIMGAGDVFVSKLNPTGTSLLYSTYLGGSVNDFGFRITLDSSGNTFIGGRTYSTDFPTTSGVYQNKYKGGDADAFVSKLDPTGTSLLYSTYFGGSSYDSIMGIAVDKEGNTFIGGYTRSTDFPTTSGSYQSSNKGLWDTFISKLDPTGSILLYSTYLGGSDYDYIEWGIAVDAWGNAYVAGYTMSPNFPTTPGSYQTSPKGAGDAFVSKLDPTGSILLYSTYLGGSGDDFIQGGIVIDAWGNAYVAGYTMSPNFPTTPGSYQTSPKGAGDAFVSKLDPTGSILLYSTYLGGSGDDIAQGIALDADGNAYITGRTLSIDFPTTPGSYQNIYRGGGDIKGGGDIFVVKLSLISSPFISHISLSPSIITLKVGETQQFTAILFDQNNQIVENLSINWFVQGDIGTISNVGLFTASQKGSGQIVVSYQGVESSSNVVVIDNNGENDQHFVIITLRIGISQAIVNRSGISKVVSLDVAPFTKDGRTMVPVRFISEAFGAKVEWIPEPINEIIIIYEEINIQLWIDKKFAKVSTMNRSSTSKEIELEVAPFTINSRTVVPLRFIAEVFGAVVDWDSTLQTIVITLKNK